MVATHRIAAGVVLAAACSTALAGCLTGDEARSGDTSPREGAYGPENAVPAPAPKNGVRLIGDGSTAYTGPQPGQPGAERLRPGQKPPQFVVFSWDGADEDSQRLFSRFRE